MLLSADTIQNQGLMSATADGLIQIQGHNVDLSRGGLEIQPFNPGGGGGGFCLPGGFFETASNYFPEAGVLDQFWALGTNNSYRVTSLFTTNNDGTARVVSPLFGLLPSAHPFVWTNKVSDSNYIVEAVFVQDADTNITSRVRFGQSAQAGNPARTAAIAFNTTATNIVTGQTINYSAYVLDSILSSTNFVLLTNLLTLTPMRPSPLEVTRIPPCEYVNGAQSNAVLTPDLFYSPPILISVTNLVNTNPPPNFNPTNILSIMQTNTAYATNTVTNYNASYVAELTETANTVPGLAATNQPGRVVIQADNLNLSRARIRGESEVSIQTKHLQDNSNSFINVQTLNYNLGATNGRLVIRDLAPSTVRVFNGLIEAWTAKWTNLINITNNVITPDTNVPPVFTTNTTTTTIEVDYLILMVLDNLTTVSPVAVNDFAMHSINVVFFDKMTVNGHLSVDSTSFTLTNGAALTLNGTTQNWDANDFPNLMYLTNQGSITVPNLATLGSPAKPYASIDNSGSFSAYSQQIFADQFNNSGLFSARSRLALTANSAKLDGGRFSATGDLTVQANYLKLHNYNITCNRLNLSVTKLLTDSGSGSSNVVLCPNGFNLASKPDQGDLFGTTFRSAVSAGGSVSYIWGAKDFGPTAAGFSNNVVIGKLILNADANSLLAFTGAGVSNALYVDYLEIDGALANNLSTGLAIDNNLVIYFADSNQDAQSLDGQAGGRLRWVRDFAGPNSSIPVALHSGLSVLMNRSLRNSKTIDSDGDGIPNFYDPTPLDFNDSVATSPITLSVALSMQPAPTVVLNWLGSTGTVFQVEYSTDLSPASWQTLTTYTNSSAGGFGSFQDVVTPGLSQRYYRVKLVR
jgi:hypothetical protein